MYRKYKYYFSERKKTINFLRMLNSKEKNKNKKNDTIEFI